MLNPFICQLLVLVVILMVGNMSVFIVEQFGNSQQTLSQLTEHGVISSLSQKQQTTALPAFFLSH